MVYLTALRDLTTALTYRHGHTWVASIRGLDWVGWVGSGRIFPTSVIGMSNYKTCN